MSERAQAWRNALYGGLFFGLAYGLITSFMNGWLPPHSLAQAAALGAQVLVGGTVFGVLIGLFANSRIVPKAADIALEPGDDVEYSGFANHFRNFEGRGGRLALTKTALVFKPHAVNVQRGELRIPRADIAAVAPSRTYGVLPNGLEVTLKSGKVERFVVNDRNTWVARIGGPA
jgi:hypothetical protein